MQKPIVCSRYILPNISLKINSQIYYYNLCFGNNDIPSAQNVQNAKLKPNYLKVSIKFCITEPLSHCLKKTVQIVKFWIKSTQIGLLLTTKEGQYCFDTMNYYFFAEAFSNKSSDKLQVSIIDLKQQINKTEVFLQIVASRQGSIFEQFVNLEEIALEVGSADYNRTVRSQITSVQVSAIYAAEPLVFSNNKIENKIKFIDRNFSKPIGVIKSIDQIYSNLSLKDNQPEVIQKFLWNLSKHTSVATQKQNKLFMCHDMKGGYVQDTNFQANSDTKKVVNRYRYFYLQQSQIFNYFSHFNITIPPKSWRIVCKKYQTKCLGTFIIEKPVFEQAVLCSKQFALFLVAVARKCKFDGYLLNIQIKIKAISQFKKWLQYLTYKIHQFIPNSVIIWYDSISARDGAINYQNALNQQNFYFYNVTDGIFTNYWWNQALLKLSIQTKKENIKKVYIGNDCFGRNTYGGGKYDLYKAVNKILQYKDKLSIALFAPGYTYEGAGQNNRHIYYLNELSLYKGIKSQVIVIDKWREVVNGGNGWKNEDGWAATSYEVCERAFILKFPPFEQNVNVKIQFMFDIMTPQADSPYKIVMQVLDNSNNILLQNQAHNFNNYKKAPEQQTFQLEQIDVDSQVITKNQISIKVIQMGRSRQKWAGHYGPHFKNQRVNVLIYDKERHWINKIPLNQVVIGQPFHSYFNVGYGDYFYSEGLRRQKGYNYLADFDHPHTHVINHPLQTDFDFNNAFVGGSSLLVKSQTIKLLKVTIPAGLDLTKQFQVQVTVKNTPNVQLSFKYISKIEQQRIFSAKLDRCQQINGWKQFIFRMITTAKDVKSDIRSILDIRSSQYPYYLGQIQISEISKIKPAKLSCFMQLCRDFTPTANYMLSLRVQSSYLNRILLQTQKFAAFVYFQQGIGYFGKIIVPKCQNFSIKILDVDGSVQKTILREKSIQSSDFQQIVQKEQIVL